MTKIIRIKNVSKLQIYLNASPLKTAEQVRAETGADAVCNLQLYDMRTFKPCCHLVVDGIVRAEDAYNYIYGYGFTGSALVPAESRDKLRYSNYFCGVWLCTEGEPVTMYPSPDQRGKRGQTAIGRGWDGSIIINVRPDSAAYQVMPEELQSEMIAAGCRDAVMMDGGGSSQLSSDVSESKSPIGRRVQSYLCVWGDTENMEKGEDIMSRPIICLDAGHGKNTAGKRCLKRIDPDETREWVLNDRLARYAAEGLKKYACQTMRVDDTTGETDVSLYDRVKKANDADAAAFISFHHNAGINGGDGGGICVFVSDNASDTSKKLQDAVYASTVNKTGLVGNRAEPKPAKGFYVIRYTNMPAILGEYGFMDSTADTPVILTDDFARKCAEGIVEGIVEVMGLALSEDETADESAGETPTEDAAEAEPTAEQPSDYAVEACRKAVTGGVFQGDGKGNYNWTKPITRQDFCVVLDRLGLL